MTEYPFTAQDLEALKAWDTPTICNGLEIVSPERQFFCYFDDVFLSYVQHIGMPAIFVSIERAWLSYIGEDLEEVEGREEREKAGNRPLTPSMLNARESNQ